MRMTSSRGPATGRATLLDAIVLRRVAHDGRHSAVTLIANFPAFAQSIALHSRNSLPDCGLRLTLSRARTGPRKATIYDLAELADVSASTVSAVLNGNWRSAASPIDSARASAARRTHKYSVNRQASGLRNSRSGLIGMIIPLHDNRFFSGMSQTFEKLARAAPLVSDRRQHAARSRARARDRAAR